MGEFEQLLMGKYMDKCGDDFEMPSYDEVAEFINGLEMGLVFDDQVYNFLIIDFMPEDQNSVADLLNRLGAT